MNYFRDPERVKSEFTAQCAVIGEYSGKSITSIRIILFLLRLPGEIQQALGREKSSSPGISIGHKDQEQKIMTYLPQIGHLLTA